MRPENKFATEPFAKSNPTMVTCSMDASSYQ